MGRIESDENHDAPVSPSEGGHPSDDALKRFLSGSLGDQEADEIEGHLADCDKCADRLANLDKSDALLQMIGRPLDPAFQAVESESDGVPLAAGLSLDELQGDLDHLPEKFRLVRLIGEGGMGLVYLARQTEPKRREVAIKVIKPGMDSRQVLARFEAERQALSLMDHDSIARIHSGGVTKSGRPFFVMEFVQGIPITSFCDQHRLTPHDRMNLVARVCDALQHAHDRGIIHRDIKPSNILVSFEEQQPAPKLIDFGVARATEQRLSDLTLFTQPGQILGTLEYMSPEQAGMSPLGVDTRTDIFSLGAVIYELIAGAPPVSSFQFRNLALNEVIRVIQEDRPPKPSTRLSHHGDQLKRIAANRMINPARIRSHVDDDLDGIVMKTLEKNRTRRYSSAAELAADIQRYLDGQPVEARPRGNGFVELIRRNRLLAATGLIATAVCVAAIMRGGSADRTPDTEPVATDETPPDESVSEPIVIPVDPGRLATVRRRYRKERHYWTAFQLAVLLAASDDPADYHEHRGDILSRAAGEWGEELNDVTLKSCLLQPMTEDIAASLAPLVDRLIAESDEHNPHTSLIKGLFEYRATRYESSIAWLTHCRDQMNACPEDDQQLNWFRANRFSLNLIESMAFTRLDLLTDAQQSREEAARLQASLPSDDAGWEDQWPNHYVCRLLTREAEGLLSDSRNATASAPALIAVPFSTADAKLRQEQWASWLDVPAEYTNSIGMEFSLIPAGELDVGFPQAQIDHMIATWPEKLWGVSWARHHVGQSTADGHRRICRAYYACRHEVTVEQFREFVRLSGYRTVAETDGRGGTTHSAPDRAANQDPMWTWQNPGYPQTDRHPVVQIGFKDATAFCEWLSERENRRYVIPTDAQWEFACRAGTDSFKFFDEEVENFMTYVRNRAEYGASPVGQLAANPFGLFNVYGNVWELTRNSRQLLDGKPPEESLSRHGGSHTSALGALGSACRNNNILPNRINDTTGFRVVIELPNPPHR